LNIHNTETPITIMTHRKRIILIKLISFKISIYDYFGPAASTSLQPHSLPNPQLGHPVIPALEIDLEKYVDK